MRALWLEMTALASVPELWVIAVMAVVVGGMALLAVMTRED